MHLTVQDDGVGYPAHVDFSGGETLGVTLIKGLTDQLEGTIAVDRSTRIARVRSRSRCPAWQEKERPCREP